VFCSGCGNNVSVGQRFCAICRKEVSGASAPAPAFGPPAEGTIFPAQTSGKAIASLVCGLFLFAFPLSILAVIFGLLSVSEIRKSSGRLQGEDISIAGLVLGYVGLAVIPLILIIAAIAIPHLLRARMAANESSAMASVRTLGAAEVQYFSSHPKAGFTCRLSDLAASGLIDSRSATGEKNGYAFDLLPRRRHGGENDFRVVAYPVVRQQTGTSAFCSDESNGMKIDRTGSPQDGIANGSTLQ